MPRANPSRGSAYVRARGFPTTPADSTRFSSDSPTRFGHVPVVPGWQAVRRGSMTDPSGSNAPVSSKITTPLQSRLQPCSGWQAITRAAWQSGALAGGQGDECWHVTRVRPVQRAIGSGQAAPLLGGRPGPSRFLSTPAGGAPVTGHLAGRPVETTRRKRSCPGRPGRR